jgi:hypothetical protein
MFSLCSNHKIQESRLGRAERPHRALQVRLIFDEPAQLFLR